MEGDKVDVETVAKSFNLGAGLLANLLKSQAATQQIFINTIKFSGLEKGEQKIGNMLYSVATKLSSTCQRFIEPLAQWVASGDITNQSHLDVLIDYLKPRELKGGADLEEAKKACGVGVKISNEQILQIVNKGISTANEKSKKFQFMAGIREKFPSVDGKLLKELFEGAWAKKGLPDKVAPPEKDKKDKKKPQKGKQKVEEQEQQFNIKDISALVGREMKSSNNSKELVEKRNKQFGNIVLTRFPPEPNGYLHIGHCKAMRFDFMLARAHNGKCYLRYDDTNPTKQNREYIDNIIQNVRFMGYQPWQITHSSNNFQQLYLYAIQLIQQGDAFVCSQKSEEVKKKRSEGLPSKDRDRSVEENLRIFNQMKVGLHEEGSYSLRAKIDYKHPNTTLRDPAIYRIKFHAHPHVGDRWCIYPLYDYAHPLCDSLEGISHSLCSLQFQIRRQLYYWPLQRLNIYRAHQWEFSRLNITYTVMSKRKLHQLILNEHVSGWDDPRLLTINGMRRRGYTPEIINSFCDATGVSRKGNQNYVQFGLLEHEARKYLDLHAPRTMAVLQPVELLIEDLPQSEVLNVPLFPKNEEKGTRMIQLTKRVLVQRSDIKIADQKGFYGIAPNKVIGLKYAHPIFIREVKTDNQGQIVQVIGIIDPKKTKPNSYLNWLSVEESLKCEVRNYGVLFDIERPSQADNYIAHINPKSIEIMRDARIHRDLVKGLAMDNQFQFQRKGFYCLDKDTNIPKNKWVFNQIVGLVDRLKK